MKKVFKYQFEPDDYINFTLPRGAKILTVQEQLGILCLWALVDVGESMVESRSMRMAGTGHSIDDYGVDYRYINTIQLAGGSLVFHFFEVMK